MAQRIAECSYGIYLSHLVVLWLVIDVLVGWQTWIRASVLVGASAGVPMLCYWLIEKPFITYGASLAQWLRREHLTEAPAAVCRNTAFSWATSRLL
jgi:peptidoglycan/LPS O-acetylase OafA/YrhL